VAALRCRLPPPRYRLRPVGVRHATPYGEQSIERPSRGTRTKPVVSDLGGKQGLVAITGYGPLPASDRQRPHLERRAKNQPPPVIVGIGRGRPATIRSAREGLARELWGRRNQTIPRLTVRGFLQRRPRPLTFSRTTRSLHASFLSDST
jgi:hypothetical protein